MLGGPLRKEWSSCLHRVGIHGKSMQEGQEPGFSPDTGSLEKPGRPHAADIVYLVKYMTNAGRRVCLQLIFKTYRKSSCGFQNEKVEL